MGKNVVTALIKIFMKKLKTSIYAKYCSGILERYPFLRYWYFYCTYWKKQHTTNLEFLADWYLFSYPDKCELLSKLNKLLVTLSYFARLFANDYFIRDIRNSNYPIDNLLYNIKHLRKRLPNFGYGSLYRLTYKREIEIPEISIPKKTNVWYCHYNSSYEWYRAWRI